MTSQRDRPVNANPLPHYHPLRWFLWGSVVLLVVVVASTATYWLLGRHYGRTDWQVMDCLFMVVITLSTIGYGDWLNLRGLPLAEIFTMGLAIFGMAVPAFVITNLTALVVGGMFSNAFRRQRMEKQIDALSGHIIVCGVGTTGFHCLEELLKTKRPCVVIDRDEARLQALTRELGDFLYMVGSAENDETLKRAGVQRALGLIACLTEDKDNLFVTLSARALNPQLRIVAKVLDEFARTKMLTAGANNAVNPTAIGGLRLVSEMVRPAVVTFLDTMMRDRSSNFRFEELSITTDAPMAGQPLAHWSTSLIGKAQVVAARAPGETQFTYNPSPDTRLTPGTTLVLLGSAAEIAKLQSGN